MNWMIKISVVSFLFMNWFTSYAESKNIVKKDVLFYRDTLVINGKSLEGDKPWTNFFEDTYPNKKNDIRFVFSIPYVNTFNFKPDGFDKKIKLGFLGFSSGLEYFYTKNKYLSLRFFGATNFSLFSLIKAAGKELELLSTVYVEFVDNYKLGKLNVGLGVNYAINNWKFVDETDSENEINITRTNRSFGLTANTYYQFHKSFFVGLVYRPSFYRVYPVTDFKYEHLLSLDFIFKLSYKKK